MPTVCVIARASPTQNLVGNNVIMSRKRRIPPSSRQAWYGAQSWRNRSKHQRRVEPLCKFCLARGIITPAVVADHVEPHCGDFNKFKLGALQSLCKQCHYREKRIIERRGYSLDTDVDGYPLDRNHPAYK
jgi:5-methylcytosine-specific restriction endonuclease McrA